MIISIRQPQCFSEIGARTNQEDFLWPSPQEVNTENRVFVMCDGMGGHDKGEVASRTVATALGAYLSDHLAPGEALTKAAFEQALAHANDALDDMDDGAFKKMGTTMTCIVLHSGGVLAAHIGDSRIYHVRPSLADADGRSGIIYQSADHSLVNQLLRIGEITEEEAADFPQKNVITRAMQPHLERRHKADIINIDDVQEGDYFFLCSDGVLEQLSNEKLGAILKTDQSDEAKIHAILKVCEGKTRDNHTCWLVPIDRVEAEEADVEVSIENEDDAPATVLNCQPEEKPEEKPEKADKSGCLICSLVVKIFKK